MKKLMMGLAPGLISGALLSCLSGPASAVFTQHLYCGVVQLVIPVILVGQQTSASLTVRNTSSRTIAAGTTYTYKADGRTGSFQGQSALAPGDHVSIQFTYDASKASAYTCDAWVPEVFVGHVPTKVLGQPKTFSTGKFATTPSKSLKP